MARTWTASQEDAMNLRGRLLVVSAAAGSGKTSVLTERIIRILTDTEHPAELSRLLIVTFTRAAAAELKSRIAKALGEALAADPENTHLSRQVLSLGSAHISTIDAFFGEEVRAGFAQLGLPPAFRLADEAELDELALTVMEDTVTALYDSFTEDRTADPNRPFARLAGNRFSAVMDHLLGNRRNEGLTEKLWRFYRRFANYPEGISLLLTHAADLRQAADTDFFASTAGKSICKFVATLCADNLRGFDAVLHDLAGSDLLPKFEGCIQSDSDFCHALLRACTDGTYNEARALVVNFSAGRLPSVKGEKPPVLERYKAQRDNLKVAVKNLCTDFFAWSEEDIRRQLLLHADACDMLHTLFSRFGKALDEEKRTRGILSFDDMPVLLRRLLENADGSPTPYARSLSDRYDAVFIDEYQDVNPIQDRLFADIGGEKRFMVGDIKQSIYGFRGGEPSIFASYRRALPVYNRERGPEAGGVCVFMSENFRCSQPVIDYANRVCSFLFSACEESVGYRPQDDLVCGKQSPEGSLQPVRTLLFEPYSGEQKQTATESESELPNREALWVAAEVARLLRDGRLEDGSPIRPRDVAILMRTAKPMQVFADALAAWDIPAALPAGDDLLSSPLMTDTMNLLRAIDNPYRDLPLSEYLLTPAGGFSLEELGDIRAAAPDRRALYDAMCAAAESDAHPCREKAAAFVAWLEHYRALAAVQPADRFLRLLFSDPRLSPHAASPELRTLYDRARSYQALSWCGLYGFLAYFTRLCDSGELSAGVFRKSEDAVTLMTIHKSKGLEFPVVFLAGCGTQFSRKSFSEPLLFHKAVGCASTLFNSETGENEPSVLLSAVTEAIREEEREEEIRNLYVALTRARERLYVTGSLVGGAKAENLMKAASLIRRGARSAILGASNRMVWILAALRNGGGDCPFGVQIVPSDETIPLPAQQDSDTERAFRSEATAEAEPSLSMPTVSYPFEILQRIPTKAAASKLSPDLLDRISDTTEDGEDSPEAIAAAIDLMQSQATDFDALLRDRKKAAPTEVGTAMHAFSEVCDFRLWKEHGTEAEIERLSRAGILHGQPLNLLNRRQLDLFRNSALMEDILSAKEVLREQKFGLNLPLRALTRHPERFSGLERETVFVQGSIDLILIMPDGSLRLCDYKTDRLTEAECADPAILSHDLSLRHGNQLACYALAARGLFGKDPDLLGIYSFPLGRFIPLSVDVHRFG